MGIYHVVSVAEDVISMNRARQPELEAALGKAVRTICCEPQYEYLDGPRPQRITSADVLNCGAAVRHAGELHHSEFEVFVFSRGHLRPLRMLKPHELEEFMEFVRQTASK